MCMRGEIYLIDFGTDTTSCVQSGVRPAVVVSNDRANRYSYAITVLPLTTKQKKPHLPTHVLIPRNPHFGLTKNSMVLAEQLMTVDKRQLQKRIGRVYDQDIMEEITKAMQIQIGAC